jgi:hypothetical protein
LLPLALSAQKEREIILNEAFLWRVFNLVALLLLEMIEKRPIGNFVLSCPIFAEDNLTGNPLLIITNAYSFLSKFGRFLRFRP